MHREETWLTSMCRWSFSIRSLIKMHFIWINNNILTSGSFKDLDVSKFKKGVNKCQDGKDRGEQDSCERKKFVNYEDWYKKLTEDLLLVKQRRRRLRTATALPITRYISVVLFHVEHLSGTELEHWKFNWSTEQHFRGLEVMLQPLNSICSRKQTHPHDVSELEVLRRLLKCVTYFLLIADQYFAPYIYLM